ncbi:N-acetyltransferase [Paenibacillus baekrokdamisoli]|uniref:N-acetyltransferase n=1 Tax=Paenibacillus baekrokdamisoli TaxID=1712516 RepID=A0A3G9IQ56_9BACL|nr:GNAT family N-acetyltransferase [Paenibacillus baekrokdamisoli]MBB3072099.1 GNAT superfamily N-acetyltransferase [Paenibacillus baekrokdamisoli]BBH20402.1 N-acetyltransferase [Paenibacillus baekrokdamisoli]
MITIRTIAFDDLPDLARLYEDLINRKTEYTAMVDTFNAIKNNDQYIILGAFYEEKLVGSLMGVICYDLAGDCKPFMVIENVIVSTEARRQGIGRKLMLAIEELARGRGCYYLIFVSGGHRKEAHLLYEALGFKDEQVEGFRKHL